MSANETDRSASPRLLSGSRPAKVHEPIGFPGTATVRGKGLLPNRPAGIPAVPSKRHQNGLAVMAVLTSKHSFGSVKAANDGGKKTRARTIDPIDAPQAISQVEQPQRNTFEERAIGDAALIEVAKTTKDGLHHHWRFELDPVVRALQPLAKTTMADDPFTLEEIEVTSPARPRVAYVTREFEERHRRYRCVCGNANAVSMLPDGTSTYCRPSSM